MKQTILILLIFLSGHTLFANNVQIGAVTLTNQNPANDFTFIMCDVGWDNSWRNATSHDAVWLFAKYKVQGTNTWHHATLNTTGHVLPTGATSSTPTDGKGAFIFRNANGTGNISFPSVQLRWNYGVDGLSDNDVVEVRVMGIEMVYIPQASFHVGDGASGGNIYGNFEAGTSGNAFQISNENAITLGGGGAGSLGNNNRANMFGAPTCATCFDCASSGCLGQSGDDFNDATSQTLPATFPKGFNDFYIMKYEMTQQQFVDMLNLSTATQRAQLLQSGHFFPNLTAAQGLRYGISQTFPHTTSEPFVPMIYLDWIHAAAYADWSGLRPMTELEFEKACRGTATAVQNEFAWGNANVDLSNNLAVNNQSAANEGITAGYDGGGTNGNAWMEAGSQTMNTLSRVGVFAANGSNTGRVTSGGSFYGLMEMTGHAWERAVTVGTAEGRKFDGSHGNGELNAGGFANMPNWPGTFAGGVVNSNVGVGYRGGGMSFPTPNLDHNGRVSNRRLATGFYNAVIEDDGARFVRTAP